MREVVGDRTVDEVLTVGRQGIENDAISKLTSLVQELGMGLMAKIRQNLESMGHPEAPPKLIGRNIFMMLVPLPAAKRKRHFFGPHDMTLQEPDEHDEADRDVEEEK